MGNKAVKKLVPFAGEEEEDTGRCEGCDEELSGEETEEEAEAEEEEEEDWNIADRVKMVTRNACWMQEVPLIQFFKCLLPNHCPLLAFEAKYVK